MADKQEDKRRLLPVARMINSNLWERDVFVSPGGGKGTPKYNIEVAMPDTEENRDRLDEIFAEATAMEFGDEDRYWNGEGVEEILTPILEGDRLKAKREAKGKVGDAYGGMIVLRAATQFNSSGDPGPGGIQAYDEDAEEVGPDSRGSLYNGCMVQVAVTPKFYMDDKTGQQKITLYLVAVQKKGDGERLVSQADHSTLFEKAGRKAAEGGGARRRARRS